MSSPYSSQSDQILLAKRLFQEQISSRSNTIEIKNRCLNDITYTIGYQGRNRDEFVSLTSILSLLIGLCGATQAIAENI
jgi:hypothetical protein